ncbi:hypothetical protein PF008_g24438 [Phytophthora fragariae]|uniref:Uncharacterized protein n=1 Tax=Phytophthora fragariae TaxID=53985 RepID=A0A6G0QMT9_9STRA|nr:hypothetical protein PF008_g24438 [Phytophthora fragariae]
MGRKDKKQQQAKEEEKPAANAKGGKKEQPPKEGEETCRAHKQRSFAFCCAPQSLTSSCLVMNL